MKVRDSRVVSVKTSDPVHARLEWILLGSLLAVTFMVYLPVSRFDFVNYDDPGYVTSNRWVQKGLSWEGVKWGFTSFDQSNWHPFTWLSHMLDCELFGLRPSGHHFTNLLIHLANVALLFRILIRLSDSLWQSLMVSMFFALHPVNVQSVAWVSERKNLLTNLFWFIATLRYMTYARTGSWRHYLLVLVWFSCGLLSKPMVVTFPCVLLLMDYWPLRRITFEVPDRWKVAGKLLMEKVPFFLLVALCCYLTVRAQSQGGAIRTEEAFPVGMRVQNAIVSYVNYLKVLFWPVDLAVFYPHPKGSISTWQLGLSLVILLGISAACVVNMKCRPYLIVGWLWYLGTMVPVIGIVQVGEQAMADRYAYLPFIGLWMMLCWYLFDESNAFRVSRARAALIMILLCVILAIPASLQLKHWQDSVSLFEKALKSTKNNDVAHQNLGLALIEKSRYPEAFEHLQKAMSIKPDADSYNNVGLALIHLGRNEDAIIVLQRSIELRPDYAEAHNNMAAALFGAGKPNEAIQHFYKTLELDPEFSGVHFNLGLIFFDMKQWELAKEHFAKALQLAPHDEEVRTHLQMAEGRLAAGSK